MVTNEAFTTNTKGKENINGYNGENYKSNITKEKPEIKPQKVKLDGESKLSKYTKDMENTRKFLMIKEKGHRRLL